MRFLRILVIVAVILGGLFVVADRVAVGFAEDEAADRLRTGEGLADTPDVSIKGFPFLTQVVGGEFDEVEIGIKDFEAGGQGEKIRIEELSARMSGVAFSDNYSSASASRAQGSARISYDELLKTAKVEPVELAPGVTAKVIGLSDGGNGKITVSVEATVFGRTLPKPVEVLSTARVEKGTVKVHADALPKLGVPLAEAKVRSITDFQQKIDGLPAGIEVDKVEPTADGMNITVAGTDVKLVG